MVLIPSQRSRFLCVFKLGHKVEFVPYHGSVYRPTNLSSLAINLTSPKTMDGSGNAAIAGIVETILSSNYATYTVLSFLLYDTGNNFSLSLVSLR